MLRHLWRPRFFTQAAASSRLSAPLTQPTVVQYPYFIPRNSQGNLPVYTDIRNGGTRYLVLIRNVDGNVSQLAKDLSESLFPPGTDDASRLRIETIRSRNLVLTGGRWKNQVMEWLKEKGF